MNLCNKIALLLILISLIGCSTAKRASLYGGLVGAFLGGTIGAMAGKHFSPPGRINQNMNAALGATIGVATGGWMGSKAGSFFYGENPENRELKQMIYPDRKEVSVMDLGIEGQEIKINADLTPTKRYSIPTGQIPANLQDKMKRPVVIEHRVKEKFIQLPNNNTLYVPEFSVMEQTFEEGAANDNSENK